MRVRNNIEGCGMSKKRFVIKPSVIVTDSFVIIDKNKKYTFPVLESTLNYMFNKALNELHEENKTFREALQELKEIGDYQAMTIKEFDDENQKLKEENENLKDVNVQCCNDYSAMRRDVLHYKEENEQLKEQLIDCEKFRHSIYQRISKEMTQHD